MELLSMISLAESFIVLVALGLVFMFGLGTWVKRTLANNPSNRKRAATVLIWAGAVAGCALLLTLVLPHQVREEPAGFGPFQPMETASVPVETVGVDRSMAQPAFEPVPVAGQPRETRIVDRGASEAEVWRDIIDEEFEADAYPSARIATTALGHRVADYIQTRMTPVPEQIVVLGLSEQEGSGATPVTTRLAGLLRTELDTSVELDTSLSEIPAVKLGSSIVYVQWHRPHITRRNSGWDPDVYQATGPLTVRVRTPRENLELTTMIRNKTWAADFSQFQSDNPGRRLLLARTSQFCASSGLAQVAVDERAADVITEQVMPLIQGSGMRRDIPDLQVQVRNNVRYLINNGVFVLDRFVQKIKRPYGEVYRAAALAEVTPQQLDVLKAEIYEINRQRTRRREQSASFLGGGLAIVALVSLLCVGMNYATKGYYRAKLASVWLGVSLLICGGVYVLRSNMMEADLVTRMRTGEVQIARPATTDQSHGTAVALPRAPLEAAPPIKAASPPEFVPGTSPTAPNTTGDSIPETSTTEENATSLPTDDE